MNVHVAAHAGFCFGVKQAVEKTLKALEDNCTVSTYGELIHNKQVIDMLSNRGVRVAETLADAQASGGLLIIRSHGVPPEVYEEAKSLGVELMDATCPFVKKIHRIVHEHVEKGFATVIVGSAGHPEVVGIHGWSGREALIFEKPDDVSEAVMAELALKGKICVVAQTTITLAMWLEITEKMQKMLLNLQKRVSDGVEQKSSDYPEMLLFNTICSATTDRQTSTMELAKRVDLMVVVGGSHSSNTQKLYQIAKKYCKNTIYAETVRDLMMKDMQIYDNIGITAGASTPDWIIKEIIDKIEDEGGVNVNG